MQIPGRLTAYCDTRQSAFRTVTFAAPLSNNGDEVQTRYLWLSVESAVRRIPDGLFASAVMNR